MRKFTIEDFKRIDEVINSNSVKEARSKAYSLASLFTDGNFTIPDEKEFEEIIKIKEVK